jgi:hypothetical protein
MNGKDLKYILPIAVVVVLLLAIAGVALIDSGDDNGPESPQGPYELNVGPITDENGDPLEGAVVKLKNTQGDTVGLAETDSDGMALFSFDEKVDDGEYDLVIAKESYEDQEIKVGLAQTDSDIVISGVNEGVPIEMEPEVLPPLEFTVGPVNGIDGPLEGVGIELRYNGHSYGTQYTDKNGTTKFSFDTPPNELLYDLIFNFDGYLEHVIEISIEYIEETHTLSVSGDFTNITLEVIPVELPKDNPDYYKELDAYQELKDAEDIPVDVKGELDPDKDGNPEFYNDIETEAKQDVGVEEYVPVDDKGDPEYSPEITAFEPVDHDPYLENQSRSERSAGSSNGGSREENLTHYDDFITQNEMINNATDLITSYDTDAVDPYMAHSFGNEVAQSPIIINKSLNAGAFINGTNSSDKDGDGNPEHVVIWKAVFLKLDTNSDGKIDKKIVAIMILEMWDNNSNGFYENSRGFMAACVAYDNNTDGHFEDVVYVVAAGQEANIDGNYTDHFKKMGIFYNHTIDSNKDKHYEFQRAAVYVQHFEDKNSNGNYELLREFVGGFEGIDNNSNGKYEEALLIWAGGEKKDLNDDGSVDQNTSMIWVFGAVDQNEDKIAEEQALLIIADASFDNNSNGNIEDRSKLIAGFKSIDSNSNGKPEKKDAVIAFVHEKDNNDDGNMDANGAIGWVFLWTDSNEDNKPEYQKGLFYLAANYDNNSNGNFENKYQAIAGFSIDDKNSDGTADELLAVHYGVTSKDVNDDGKEDVNLSFAYVIHAIDSDSDGTPEFKHAVFGHEGRWDNNTDGVYEAVNQFLAGYQYVDSNDDGKVDEEKFFILMNLTSDKNNDGNPERMQYTLLAAHKKYDSTGGIAMARHVVWSTVAYDNNSNGNFELIEMVLFGHKGINGTQNGSKVDWETEHVLLFYHKMIDTNDDGTIDDHKYLMVKI